MYSDILLPIYPGLANPDHFKIEMQSLLDDRDQIIASADKACYNSHHQQQHDASWFALLFGVLACGAQCLSTIDAEAELNSKVFGTLHPPNLLELVLTLLQLKGSISLSCLRKANFLVSPSTNSVQALLHIGSTLRNDMNPGIAWSLLGM
jgi:hypothetical protein